ncbi:DUF4244 domain-containing protein [Cellulomonas soli]
MTTSTTSTTAAPAAAPDLAPAPGPSPAPAPVPAPAGAGPLGPVVPLTAPTRPAAARSRRRAGRRGAGDLLLWSTRLPAWARARARLRRLRVLGADAGMATAEYAIATLAAVGFAGLLLVILRSDEVRGMLTALIRQALQQ